MTEWLPGTDQLLSSMSGPGMYYKKTYYDPSLGRNVSLACSPRKIIVHNDVVDLESAERVTHEFEWSRNKVVERIRGPEKWMDIADKLDKDDSHKLERFYECDCSYDLDDDGYKEPYIITVHVETMEVVRVVPRYDGDCISEDNGTVTKIEPLQCITEFPFLPSPDGKFHKMGFYKLLVPINEGINSATNQLFDAGTLANSPPIFVGRGAKLPGGNFKTAPGKYIPVESTGQALKDNIFVPTMGGPSQVLLELLTRLDDKGMKLASVSETMMGDEPQANVPATTTLAILDQGLKVFSSVLKRLYRAFELEFRKLYRLNYLYMDDDEYIKIIDITAEELQKLGLTEHLTQIDGQIIVKAKKGVRKLVQLDFNLADCDIQPVMDPTAASEAIRLARAQAIYNADPQNPAVKRYFYEVLGVPEKLIKQFVPDQAPPDPKMMMIQAKITEMGSKHEIEMQKLRNESVKMAVQELETSYKMMLLEAQAVQAKANAELSLANSDAIQVNMHLEAFQTQIDHLNQQYQNQLDSVRLMIEGKEAQNGGTNNTEDGSGGTSGADEGSADEEGSGVPGGEEAGNSGGLAGGELQDAGSNPGGSGDLAPDGGSSVQGIRYHATPGKLATLEGNNGMM
jgi:chaperonin GroES